MSLCQMKERMYGFKFLRVPMGEPAGEHLMGPYSGYKKYSLPDSAGNPGRWSKPANPKLCHSGWHFFHKAPLHRKTGYPLSMARTKWFLVEAEGPFKQDISKTAGRRIRFISQVTLVMDKRGNPKLPSLRTLVKQARKAGLI